MWVCRREPETVCCRIESSELRGNNALTELKHTYRLKEIPRHHISRTQLSTVPVNFVARPDAPELDHRPPSSFTRFPP